MFDIVYETQFGLALKSICVYISADKPSAAKEFKTTLKAKLESLTQSPYRCRASHFIENENYRDLTHKGYTIIYKVVQDQHLIQVLDIFKWIDRGQIT
ncbi:MAG: type II toxin-antitoxin system RelE/ParE family toxin [Campylobacterales bacterium]|nr:type II toxin-antitoxin system RelE/ParE family toxin [Campylobacterales bacterium]